MKNNWVVFLAVLAVSFFCLMGWSFYRAGAGVSNVTDRDYTKHGHQYAGTEKELEASGRLGWKIKCETKGHQLTVQLIEKDGLPVPGAEGSVEFLVPGSSAPLSMSALHEIGPGLYTVDLPAVAGKEVSGHLSIRKGAALLRKNVMIRL